MNVIFMDFDGTINTMNDFNDYYHDKEGHYKKVEERIALLADICKELDCKVVIEAAAKSAIDEETMEIEEDAEWVQFIFSMFKKYGIECIGRTPNVERKTSKTSSIPMWKEDEIRLYLFRHPEIEHYCVLDDDDAKNMFHWAVGDLEKVRNHLVTPLYYADNPDDAGLLEKHREPIRKALQEENEVKKLIKRRDRIYGSSRNK